MRGLIGRKLRVRGSKQASTHRNESHGKATGFKQDVRYGPVSSLALAKAQVKPSHQPR